MSLSEHPDVGKIGRQFVFVSWDDMGWGGGNYHYCPDLSSSSFKDITGPIFLMRWDMQN